MEKVINVVKKAIKWYFRTSAQNYIWMSSGMIPPMYRQN